MLPASLCPLAAVRCPLSVVRCSLNLHKTSDACRESREWATGSCGSRAHARRNFLEKDRQSCCCCCFFFFFIIIFLFCCFCPSLYLPRVKKCKIPSRVPVPVSEPTLSLTKCNRYFCLGTRNNGDKLELVPCMSLAKRRLLATPTHYI